MKNISLIISSFVLFFMTISIKAEITYFDTGKKLFEKKDYEESRFFFEKEIVFNPKHEMSYLFLAKIYKEQEKDDLEENNLNTVLLLNPKNEEAIYLSTILSIKKSNFSKAEELISNLGKVCKSFCSSQKELREKLDNSLKSE